MTELNPDDFEFRIDSTAQYVVIFKPDDCCVLKVVVDNARDEFCVLGLPTSGVKVPLKSISCGAWYQMSREARNNLILEALYGVMCECGQALGPICPNCLDAQKKLALRTYQSLKKAEV